MLEAAVLLSPAEGEDLTSEDHLGGKVVLLRSSLKFCFGEYEMQQVHLCKSSSSSAANGSQDNPHIQYKWSGRNTATVESAWVGQNESLPAAMELGSWGWKDAGQDSEL